MRNVIVHDDFTRDPLVEFVSSKENLKAPEAISISDFLSSHGVSYDPDNAVLRRSDAGKSPNSDIRILDRVVELSSATIERMGQGASLLHRGQVFDHYQSILAEHSAHRTQMRYSTVGRLHPLPTQWHLVREAGIAVRTPQYCYGYGPTPIDVKGLADPIFKSPFDLYGWSNRTPPPAGELWDQFVVDLPTGSPVLTYFLGEQRSMHVLKEGDTPLPVEQNETLFGLMEEISALFGSSATGEILWWVDGDETTFGAFSHFLAGAARTPCFGTHASEFLGHYFE